MNTDFCLKKYELIIRRRVRKEARIRAGKKGQGCKRGNRRSEEAHKN
jgi:hypothetical protein